MPVKNTKKTTAKDTKGLKRGLGKGLNALLQDDADKTLIENGEVLRVIEVDLNKVSPNKDQPRKTFEQNSLDELAQSIKEHGIIQPLTVKKADASNYEIIAGERRWRAARIAGIKKVPVIVKTVSDQETLELALIENIQREDLNPVDEALTYKRFYDEFGLNQEEIAEKVGKSRAAIANSLRLLKLDKRALVFLEEGKISSGHARALLGLNDNELQFELAERIIEEGLSVRIVEDLIRQGYPPVTEQKDKKTPAIKDKDRIIAFKGIEKDLKTLLGAKVKIKDGKNKGKIEIEYYSDDELDRLIGLIKSIQ